MYFAIGSMLPVTTGSSARYPTGRPTPGLPSDWLPPLKDTNGLRSDLNQFDKKYYCRWGSNRCLMLARYIIVDDLENKTAELTDALDLLTQTYDDTIEALGSALDLKDAETAGHSQRVTAYTISIAKSVPVPLQYLSVLARAAFLHDIGKMAIPDKILRKPGPLDDAEKVIMRTHCEIGYNMLTRIPFLRDAADIVLAHHEFFDGTGYPRQLRGEQIPLGARIMSIANALDAMLSDCHYRNALSLSQAREEIRRCAGTQFDPKIVEVFLSIPENHWIDLRENLGSPFRLAR
jgi:putative nucleotidyltransferase with HDIG domain